MSEKLARCRCCGMPARALTADEERELLMRQAERGRLAPADFERLRELGPGERTRGGAR